ncbi:hypothetical protein [Oleispirillum naphthae]|uniref:hypothetical protein n=1 Tax=Oleispirillum naphthae TaxID=2838853 RepID=UPI0030825AC5
MVDERHLLRVAYVVSTGRTATEFLAWFFSQAFPDRVTALHQPAPYRLFRPLSNAHVSGHLGENALRLAFRLARGRRLRRIATPIYLESNNYLYGFANLLAGTAPGTTPFHVVRHPFDFIRSQLNFGSSSGLKKLMADRLPFWSLKPEYFGEAPAWRDRPPEEQYAYAWVKTNAFLDRARAADPRWRLLRFEDIFDAQSSGLEAMVEALGLIWRPEIHAGMARQPKNASHGGGLPPWRNWDPALLARLRQVCGEAAAVYGYDLDAREG